MNPQGVSRLMRLDLASCKNLEVQFVDFLFPVPVGALSYKKR